MTEKKPSQLDVSKEILGTLQALTPEFGSVISKLDALIAHAEANGEQNLDLLKVLINIEVNAATTWQRINDLDATMRGLMDYLKGAARPGIPKGDTADPLPSPRDDPDARYAREHPKTEWKATKNPDIEWCSERDAHPDDVERAKSAKGRNAPMWYRGPTGDFEYGSIFRRTPR